MVPPFSVTGSIGKMNIVIYYSSFTGNTKKMAYHVADFLRSRGNRVTLIQNQPNLSPLSAKLHIIAFWCRRSNMDDLSKTLLTKMHGENVIALGTIGGNAAGDYGRRVENNVKGSICQENFCCGVRICQGAIDLDRIRKRMDLPKTNPHHADQLKYEKALRTQGHPDAGDLKDITNYCDKIFEKINRNIEVAGEENEK